MRRAGNWAFSIDFYLRQDYSCRLTHLKKIVMSHIFALLENFLIEIQTFLMSKLNFNHYTKYNLEQETYNIQYFIA